MPNIILTRAQKGSLKNKPEHLDLNLAFTLKAAVV